MFRKLTKLPYKRSSENSFCPQGSVLSLETTLSGSFPSSSTGSSGFNTGSDPSSDDKMKIFAQPLKRPISPILAPQTSFHDDDSLYDQYHPFTIPEFSASLYNDLNWSIKEDESGYVKSSVESPSAQPSKELMGKLHGENSSDDLTQIDNHFRCWQFSQKFTHWHAKVYLVRADGVWNLLLRFQASRDINALQLLKPDFHKA